MNQKELISTTSIQSVDRAFAILELICRSSAPLSVKEISDILDLKRPTVNGLVATLYHNGYICRDDISGKYISSVKMFSLCHNYPYQRNDLQQIIITWGGLTNQFSPGLSLHLGLYDGDQHVLVIRLVASSMPQSLHVYNTMPLHASGLGKCILAFSPKFQDESVLERLPLLSYTRNTITDKSILSDTLTRVRECGYATDAAEYLDNTFCMAFPVFNAKNEIVAAISASSTQEDFDKNRDLILRNGLQVSKLCSMQLGWRP